jgi:bacteriocin-like protein
MKELSEEQMDQVSGGAPPYVGNKQGKEYTGSGTPQSGNFSYYNTQGKEIGKPYPPNN